MFQLRVTVCRTDIPAAGTVKLVGAHAERIVEAATELLTDQAAYDAMANVANPYGDGKAAQRIVRCIQKFLA